jgi:uncharacterized Zn finger protein
MSWRRSRGRRSRESSWGFPPYVTVSERREDNDALVAKMIKKGETLDPVVIEARSIAKSVWGKAWCKHLESFSDYENRLPRGRSYVRYGSVVNLDINQGQVKALVSGSSLYTVDVSIINIEQQKWQSIIKQCSGEVGSLIELLQGKISSLVMNTMIDQKNGLFPLPNEIKFKCSCLDSAYMCKHVAATLYGVGARFDVRPELLFMLRGVDHMDIIKAVDINDKIKKVTKTKTIETQDLSSLFGIDIDEKDK